MASYTIGIDLDAGIIRDGVKRPEWSPSDEFNFSVWYDAIREYTFPTVQVPLYLDEARAMLKYYELAKFLLLGYELKRQEQNDEQTPQTRKGIIDPYKFAGGWPETYWFWAEDQLEGRGNPDWKLKPEEIDPIKRVIERIDKAINENFKDQSVFVKLSSRSPKDVSLILDETEDILVKLVKDSIRKHEAIDASPLTKEKMKRHSMEEDGVLFMRAVTQTLQARSGEEAMRLLLRSSRANVDMSTCEMTLHNSQDRGLSNLPFSLDLFIRQWNPEILPEWEFRTVIFNGKMTGITQYSKICFVPGMYEKREAIAERIHHFWLTKIKDKVEGALRSERERLKNAGAAEENVTDTDKDMNYVVDFVLSPDLSKVWVIEVNNSPPLAGTALFKWKNTADRKLLEEGPGLTIRVNERPPAKMHQKIHPPLRNAILKVRGLPYEPVLRKNHERDRATTPIVVDDGAEDSHVDWMKTGLVFVVAFAAGAVLGYFIPKKLTV